MERTHRLDELDASFLEREVSILVVMERTHRLSALISDPQTADIVSILVVMERTHRRSRQQRASRCRR